MDRNKPAVGVSPTNRTIFGKPLTRIDSTEGTLSIFKGFIHSARYGVILSILNDKHLYSVNRLNEMNKKTFAKEKPTGRDGIYFRFADKGMNNLNKFWWNLCGVGSTYGAHFYMPKEKAEGLRFIYASSHDENGTIPKDDMTKKYVYELIASVLPRGANSPNQTEIVFYKRVSLSRITDIFICNDSKEIGECTKILESMGFALVDSNVKDINANTENRFGEYHWFSQKGDKYSLYSTIGTGLELDSKPSKLSGNSKASENSQPSGNSRASENSQLSGSSGKSKEAAPTRTLRKLNFQQKKGIIVRPIPQEKKKPWK